MSSQRPTPAGVRYIVEPRMVPAKKAARRLHLSHGEFIEKLRALRQAGFPVACDVTGHYDLKAIDAWMDGRSGLSQGADGAKIDVSAKIKARIAAIGKGRLAP